MEKLPKKDSKRGVSEVLAVAAVSVVPIVGGPFSIVLQEMLGVAYGKRRDAWLEELAARVEDLLNKVDNLNLDDLSRNEIFLDAVASATQSAVRTHDKEKIALLGNAVLNAAIQPSMDSDKLNMFMQYVSDLTVSHIQLLDFLDNPPLFFEKLDQEWPDFMMGGISSLLQILFPQWTSEFSNQLLRLLRNSGLVSIESLNVTMSGSGLRSSVTTSLGKEFLAFITKR
ncbi:MAG: hypothetical protein Q7R42_04760 [Candidatus Planktophila sp.]|nr:hypothetical protein [Candidatus Planktophila sp.]